MNAVTVTKQQHPSRTQGCDRLNGKALNQQARKHTSTGLEVFLLLDSVRARGARREGSLLSELYCMPASICNSKTCHKLRSSSCKLSSTGEGSQYWGHKGGGGEGTYRGICKAITVSKGSWRAMFTGHLP